MTDVFESLAAHLSMRFRLFHVTVLTDDQLLSAIHLMATGVTNNKNFLFLSQTFIFK